ncbi:MAG: hypothetical protein FH753_07525 [Firmicutes bacterium]|nr:hypothetical protein [Bacillota bacterium]
MWEFFKILLILIALTLVLFTTTAIVGVFNIIDIYNTFTKVENGDISKEGELYEIESNKDIKNALKEYLDIDLTIYKILDLDNRKVVIFSNNTTHRFGHSTFTKVEKNLYSHNFSSRCQNDDTKLFRVETNKGEYIILARKNKSLKIKDLEIVIPHPKNDDKDLKYEYDVSKRKVIIESIKVSKEYSTEIKKIVYRLYDEFGNNIW